MDGNTCSPMDDTVAFLAKKDLVYILGEDPSGFIPKAFPDHPDYAFIVKWLASNRDRVESLTLTDAGQLHDHKYITERTALFDTLEEATIAAEEFDCEAGVGTTIAIKYEVGSLAPPKGGRHDRRSK